MAYSELIKDFNKIRDYMRQFYVYGFKTRDEYDKKSGRSYDNERRRIESWIGEYMSFRQDPAGKVSFISVDSAKVDGNPLYNAFKAKSFTANDIVLNFFLLDILQPGVRMAVPQITRIIDERYMPAFANGKVFDEATIRNKLKEYVNKGILTGEKDGRRVLYQRLEDGLSLDDWTEAIAFCSEADPVGVIGSFLLDKAEAHPDYFAFKHHYILHALESDILCTLLDAITDDHTIELAVDSRRKKKIMKYNVLPLRIYLSTESGRGYLLGQNIRHQNFNMYRLDRIQSVRKGSYANQKPEVMEKAEAYVKYLWNTSSGDDGSLDHLEMTLRIEPWAKHILQRLEREGKHGLIEPLGEDRYRYSIDVYDATEMRPWIRTFIGRIESLSCSNPDVTEVFYEDLDAMYRMYSKEAGEDDAV